MTPQELKASILQLAIQGKLVEQRPDEGTGGELLEKILAASTSAKASVDKKGAGKNLTRRRGERGVPSSHVSHLESSHAVEKIYAHATLPSKNISANSASPREEIPDSEKPFDIPESWEWVRLGELLKVIGGVSYDKKDVCNSGLRILRGGNIQNMEIVLDDADVFLPEQYRDVEKIVRVGDILIVASTGSKTVIGKAGYVDKPIPQTMIGAFLRICRPSSLEFVGYLRIMFDSDFYRKHIRELSQGTNINNIKEAYITQFAIPLPPFAEQKRIVAKIEELLPYIDRYEKAWSKLEDFNKRFPGDMQKSLLQMAIQGKLVGQRPEEGTGEELLEKILATKNTKGTKKNSRAETPRRRGKSEAASPREDIPDDEKPFDIPESWAWVRFLSVVDIATNLVSPAGHENDRHIAPDNIEKGTGRLLESRTVAEDKVVSSNHRFFKGQLIYSKIRPLLRKVVIAPFDGLCSADMYPLNAQIDSSFLLFYMLSDAFNIQIARAMSSRVKMPKINQEELSKVLLPLPPLAEQKRIVAKLEELLPLCERLK